MASNIKGITIEIDGNTTGLSSALKDVNKNINSVNYELKQVNNLLKFDSGNTELVAQKQQLLQKAIADTNTKLYSLKKAKEDADRQFANGDINEKQYRELTREVAKTENSLKGLEKELEDSSKSSKQLAKETERLKKEQQDASKSTSVFGDVLKANLASDITLGAIRGIANGIVAIGKATAGYIASSVQLASNLAEVQNVVDVTFGDGADTINKFAVSSASAFGLSELSSKKMTGTMGAMLKSMGLTDKETLKMSTSMTGLAGDFASFYNLDGEEAFNKIRAGISGETEPLKQLGINMSVANLEAYALAEGIKKSYSEMTQSEQATLRYNYLMKVSADAQGDFARTSGGLANQQRILKLGIETLSASLGKELIPAFTGVISPLNQAMSEINQVIYDGFQAGDSEKIDKIVDTLADNLGTALNNIIPKVVGILTTVLNTVVKTLVKILPVLLPQLLTGFLQLLQSLYTAIAQNIAPLSQMVMGMVRSLAQFFIDNAPMLLQAGITMIIELAKGFAEALPELIPQIVDLVFDLIDMILENIDAFIDAGILLTIALVEGLIEAIPQIIDRLPYIVEKIAEALIDNAPKILVAGVYLLGQLIVGLLGGVVDLVLKIPEFVASIVTGMLESDIIKDFQEVGVAWVVGVWDGFIEKKEWLSKKIGKWSKEVKGWFKKVFDINSPSKVMRDEIGKNLGLGVALGIEDSLTDVQKAMAKANSVIMGGIGDINIKNPAGNTVSINVYTQTLNDGEQDNLIRKVNQALGNVY